MHSLSHRRLSPETSLFQPCEEEFEVSTSPSLLQRLQHFLKKHVEDYLPLEYWEQVDRARSTLSQSLDTSVKARLAESWPAFNQPLWDPKLALDKLRSEYDREDQVRLSKAVHDFWLIKLSAETNIPGTAPSSSVRSFLHALQKNHLQLSNTDFQILPRDLCLHVGEECRQFISLSPICHICDEALDTKRYPSAHAIFKLLEMM